MDALLERLSNPIVLLPIAVLILYIIYNRLNAKSRVPAGLPWIGRDASKLFSESRAALSSFRNVRQWLNQGYERVPQFENPKLHCSSQADTQYQYSKNGKTYIFPDFSGQPEIIIPRSQVHWLLDQPDNILSTSAYHFDALEGSYAFLHPRILGDPYHEHVIHKYLPRRLGAMVPGMSEEISSAFEETWGTDTQDWKDIGVFDNLMAIIPRAVNRMMVGLPLCRNQDFLSNMKSFANDVIAAATVFLRFTPRWLKPVVGRIVTIPNTYHWKQTAKYTLPIIIERLANIKRKKEDPNFKWEEPNDYISWHINIALAENRQDELMPDMISRRLMPLNFAAIHTTTLTITNCLFDLISSDPSKHYLEGIREDVERVLAEEGGQWTKAGLARCHRADSTIRESMRISNFMTRGILRKVLPEEGVENKAEGWRAPKGAYVGLDVHSVQHDPDIYPIPETYDAFRFSRPKEEDDASGPDSDTKKGDDLLKLKNTDLITTSDSFLPFGHGRHACPGRFFVSLELKMLLAYMVINYEVEPLATRPPNTWFGQNNLPPFKAKIRVRRRKGTVAQ